VAQEPPAVFRTGGPGGFSDAIKSDPRHVEARKRTREVEVHFAEAERSVQTSEGVVHAKPGMPSSPGRPGALARVARSLPGKYQPVAPSRRGCGFTAPCRTGSSRCA